MRFLYLVIAALAFLAYVSSDSCVQCNSNTDPKCATHPERFLAKECANATSKCYSRVLNGATIRGCASELDNSTASTCFNEMECLICTFMEGCNRNVFPTHRALCLQCTGNGTGVCASDTFARPKVCPIYKLGERCFIRKTSNSSKPNSFMRGCLSSAQADKMCLRDDCYTCEGNGCNYNPSDSAEIPMARDSASLLSFSFYLILTSIFLRLKFF